MKHEKRFKFGKQFMAFLLLIAMFLSFLPSVSNIFSISIQATDVQICDLKVFYYAYGTETEISPHDHVRYPNGTKYKWDAPIIKGYELADGSPKVIEGTLSEDTVIKIYYIEGQKTAEYRVNYFTMNVDGSDLKLYDYYTDTTEINEVVRVDMITIPGYSWSVSDLLLTVTADGLAVKNIFFIKTDYRVIALRTGTGYAQTITALPGDEITEQVLELSKHKPTKAGYIFDDWDQKLTRIYDENGTEHIYMPDEDMIINAIWIPNPEAFYFVEFYFENLGSTDPTDPNNYTRRSDFDQLRKGTHGTYAEIMESDKLIADQAYLFTKIDVDLETGIETKTVVDECQHTDVYKDEVNGSTLSSYKLYSGYFGFDFAFADIPVIDVEGQSVMKLYYSREERTIKLWKYPYRTGANVTKNNDIWNSFTGKYDEPLPDDFPSFFDMADYYNKTKVYCTANTDSNSADQKTLIFDETEFVLTLPDKTVTGTYTQTGNTITMTTSDNETITAMVYNGKYNGLVHEAIKFTYDGESYENQFFKGEFLGMVEQNRAGTASTTQNIKNFRTSTDVIDGVLDFYPKFTLENMVFFTRILYAMPLEINGGFNEDIKDVSQLTEFFNRSSKAQNNGITTLQATNYPGYTLTGGKYRVAGTKEAVSNEDWLDITTNTNKRCYINKDGVLTLKRDGDSYFEVQLAPVKTTLKFYNGGELLKEVDENGHQVDKTKTVQYTEPLSFLLPGNSDYEDYKLDDTAEKRFVGWYLDSEFTQPVDENSTCQTKATNGVWYVYAKWEPKNVIMTFDSMGGTPVPPHSEEIGGTLEAWELPTTTKDGFELVGWYTENGVHFNIGTELIHDTTLYAVWKPVSLAEYTVHHILVKDGEEIELSQYTEMGFGAIGDTITVNALSTRSVLENGVGYYISVDKKKDTTHSITLSNNSSQNVAYFYYEQQSSWNYAVSYLDRYGNTIKDKRIEENTDLLFVSEAAPHIDGYTMIECDGTYQNGIDVYAKYGIGYISAYLSVSGENDLYIYYDKLYTLKFNLQGGMEDEVKFANRSLIYCETTELPEAPTYDNYIFLGWNTEADGSGITYDPKQTYEMPENDVVLYAQWAKADVKYKPGRLLNRLIADSKDGNIAKNGTVTMMFSITEESEVNRIDPNNLRIWAEEKFPVGTVMTLIVYPDKEGQSNAQFYYYYVMDNMKSVKLTDFVGMGKTESFNSETKVSAFWCQICVEYPNGNTKNTEKLSLSTSDYHEIATEISLVLNDVIISPVGSIFVTDNTAIAGKLNTTVTVSNLANLTADPSDSRHTHDTLANYESVLAVTLQDANGKSVPFPEDSTVKIDSTIIKQVGKAVGIVTGIVGNGTYAVTATGLLEDIPLTVCFTLCAADSNKTHPMRLPLATKTMELAYTEASEYAIHAELIDENSNQNDYRIFSTSELTSPKTLTFAIRYFPADSTEDIIIASYIKENGSYITDKHWYTSVNKENGIATVTIPAETEAGTYRLVFAIGNATYNINLIVMDG